MPDFTFNQHDRVELPTKYHRSVSLSKAKWDEICLEPERFYYRENAEKVSTALINPDSVRISHNTNQFIYYKEFDTFTLGNREVNSRVKFWAVIIDTATSRVCTVYPVIRPKPGKEYKA